MLNEPHSVYGYEKRVYQRPGLRRQACSPLIQLFFGFASDIDQTNTYRDIRDGNWLSNPVWIYHCRLVENTLSNRACVSMRMHGGGWQWQNKRRANERSSCQITAFSCQSATYWVDRNDRPRSHFHHIYR